MSAGQETSRNEHDENVTVGRIEQIERNAAGQLVVHLVGRDEPVVDAKVARCFPWSGPDGYISIRDAEGNELVLLKTLDEVGQASRRILDEELRDRIFNPKIIAITDHKSEFGVTSITAETDRGQVTFQIRGSDDIRILSPRRALLRDIDGNTYELVDVTALAPKARKFLERYF